MKNTNIEWTDHTINFWWGCTKVSPACANCYAESVAKVFGRRIFGDVPQWGAGKPRAERLEAARKEALALNRKAMQDGTRPRVFVNSMSDWLDDEVPIEWLAYLLETIRLCPHLDFQLLTKRPENWSKRLVSVRALVRNLCDGPEPRRGEATKVWHWLHDWQYYRVPPPNVWIGATAENQEMADQRIPALLRIHAKVRFLSCEPLLGPLDFVQTSGMIHTLPHPWLNGPTLCNGIHWVIAGGESGGKARPSHPDWFRVLRDQCAAAAVPFFFKQWGEWCPATEEFGVTGHVMPDNGVMACGKPALWVDDDGKMQNSTSKGLRNPFAMARMGSQNTGRLLDGVEHSAFPA